MSTLSYSYSSGSQFKELIRRIADNFKNDRKRLRFVIPSRKDKRWWPLDDTSNLWTWQDIYDDVYGEGRRRVLSPPDHLLILKKILNDTIKSLGEKVKALPGIERSGFIAVLSDDIRELLNEAVRPEQLPLYPDSDNPSEFLLPRVYSDYLKYLSTFNLLDSAQVYTAAYDAIVADQGWGKDYIIVFAGFLSFNHGQLQLVEAIRDRCRQIITVKPEAFMPHFYDSDSQLSLAKSSCHSSGRLITVSPAEPGLEPEIIARLLALWSKGKWNVGGEFPGFDSIGLMISEGREEAFAQSFKRYSVPYDFADGIAISRTLPGKILSLLRNLTTENFPAYDTAIMLTQPCFAGSNFPVRKAHRAGRFGLDSWIEYLNEKHHNTFETALTAMEAIKKFCAVLRVKNTPAIIMGAFSNFLHTEGIWLDRLDNIAPYPELDEAMRLTASAIQTVDEKLLSLNELLPDLGSVQDERLSGDEAYEYLADWCRNSHVRAQIQLTNSVRIFTGQPPVLSSFPVWIMSGVTQKTWSPNMKSSPLLGNEEREKLRENEAYLPRTKEKAEQREALFRRLLQTGESMTILSRPLLDDDGRPVSDSPFLKKFTDDMKDWTTKSIKTEGINILLGSDGYRFIGIDADGREKRKAPSVSVRADFVGASDIQELLECPFLWYQHRRAELYQPDSELVSPVEWGNMLHKYWECVWKIYRDDMKASGNHFTSIAKSEWERLMKAEDEDYKNFSPLVTNKRLKRKLTGLQFRANRLAGVQGVILDKFHEDYEHERILLEDEAHLRVEHDGVKFFGQCDRIEILRGRNGSKIAFIADYKEGSMASYNYDAGMKDISQKSWNIDNKEFSHGLQLSLYAAMFNEDDCELSGVYILGHEDGKVSGTFSQGTAEKFRGFFPVKDGRESRPDTNIQQRFNEGVYAMECAVRILKGERFSPDYDSDRCRYCRIKSICRKGEIRGEISNDDGSDAQN